MGQTHWMAESSLRDVMSRFATGVTVLTAGGEHGHGMTANAFTSVSLEPPLVLACVAHSARIHESIRRAGGFGVSMLAADQQMTARYFANKQRPIGLAQFDAIDCEFGPHTGAPLLNGALAWLECELAELYPGGDHSIFLGRVLSASRGPDRQALLFYAGGFHHLLPPAKSA
ncbi:MAG TPA: flavin reductase family protein [Actinophytocola sp.]|uniref:flavin reductase family protein n=1 Tax=Actinophytocola sp. TaxID=1872138 RepID=UPI002DB5CA99|nr:flavin reductase family protein [Actinophytocola sp.]HEU5475557.1 flavin reductase family protein [Actinophytocola sp.]